MGGECQILHSTLHLLPSAGGVNGGWTESDNRQFRSLMFGHYVNGQFTYVHHSGGGFTDKQMKELSSKLKKIEINESPFVNPEKMKTKVHWVKPVLVAEFEKSTNTTASGRIRHPAIFIGLREDKKAKDVVEEIPKRIEEPKFKKEVTKQKAEPNKSNKENAKQYDAEIGSWETLEKRKVTSENELIVEGHKLNLINIERELWPDITKADLIQYYISIADYILLYLRDRPLGLNICLGSPAKGGFFLRGMEGHAPSWAKVFTTERKHKKPGKSDNIEWLLCNDKATLVYIVNFESIDIHPWTSRISSPTNPDYIVIDIDPSDDDFRKSNRDCTCSKTII